MNKIQVQIYVHPSVREFFIGRYGSEVIEIKKNDAIFDRIKYVLSLKTKDMQLKRPSEKAAITLLLPKYEFKICQEKRVNTNTHSFISERHQSILKCEFQKLFKEIFHNYVLGYCRNGAQQKQGIYDFCATYNISMNHANFDMLKKSWDRSDQKKRLKITA